MGLFSVSGTIRALGWIVCAQGNTVLLMNKTRGRARRDPAATRDPARGAVQFKHEEIVNHKSRSAAKASDIHFRYINMTKEQGQKIKFLWRIKEIRQQRPHFVEAAAACVRWKQSRAAGGRTAAEKGQQGIEQADQQLKGSGGNFPPFKHPAIFRQGQQDVSCSRRVRTSRSRSQISPVLGPLSSMPRSWGLFPGILRRRTSVGFLLIHCCFSSRAQGACTPVHSACAVRVRARRRQQLMSCTKQR